MLTYIDFYCISEHLGAWDRGNMNILKIGTKMTSGSLRFSNWIPRGAQFWRPENGEVEGPPKSLILAEGSSKIWEAVASGSTSSFPYNP